MMARLRRGDGVRGAGAQDEAVRARLPEAIVLGCCGRGALCPIGELTRDAGQRPDTPETPVKTTTNACVIRPERTEGRHRHRASPPFTPTLFGHFFPFGVLEWGQLSNS
jgi:hypothetical protein